MALVVYSSVILLGRTTRRARTNRSDTEDEHDIDEEDGVRDLGDDVYMVKATLAIEDQRGDGTKFADDEFDTIGGLVVHAFGHLPAIDETATLGPAFEAISPQSQSPLTACIQSR